MSAAAMSDLDQHISGEKAEAEGGNNREVREEEVKLNPDRSHDCELDLKDRDPNRLNEHIKVKFSEIFGEPEEEVYSFDKVWLISFKVFSLTKSWCYRITSVVLAIPLAVVWGLLFALLSFCNNWCCIPSLKFCQIELLPLKKLWDTCLLSFVAPLYQAIGYFFSKISVHYKNNGPSNLV